MDMMPSPAPDTLIKFYEFCPKYDAVSNKKFT